MGQWTQHDKNEQRFLKVNLYGDSGTGKTIIALGFPNPGLIALEQGQRHYRKDFDFIELEPEGEKWKFDELLADINKLQDPKNHPTIPGTGEKIETLIIDSISLVMAGVQGIIHDEQREKIRKSQRTNKNDLTQKDWADMKYRYEKLMNALDRLPMNVVVIGRMKTDSETKMKYQFADVSTEYVFDIFAEITHQADKKRVIHFWKDRTKHFHRHQEIEDPTYERVFKPIFDDLQKGGIPLKKDTGGKPKEQPTPTPAPEPEPEPPKEEEKKPSKKKTPPKKGKGSKKKEEAKAEPEPEPEEGEEEVKLKEGYRLGTIKHKGKIIQDVQIPDSMDAKGAFLMSAISDKKHTLHKPLKDYLNGRTFDKNIGDEEIDMIWMVLVETNEDIEIEFLD